MANTKFIKKIGISIGSLAAIVTPVITIISCAKGNITYKIVVDNAKDKNYTLSTQDVNYQPINFQKGSDSFWDTKSTLKIDKLEKLLGTNSTQKLIFGIRDNAKFENGLEKLVYDLLKANDNKIDLTLTYTVNKNNSPSIVIPKSIIKEQENSIKTAEFRASQFKNSKIVFDDYPADEEDRDKVKNLVKSGDFKINAKYESLSSKYTDKKTFDDIVEDSTLGTLKDIYKDLKTADSSTTAIDLSTPNVKIVDAFTKVFDHIKLIKYDSNTSEFTSASATSSEWNKAIDDMLAEIKK